MFRCKEESQRTNGPQFGPVRLRVDKPAAGAGGNAAGLLGYRLGVVGERSSGDEVPMRVGMERGEVRIPE